MSTWVDKLKELSVVYGVQILGAILIFLVGRWVARVLKGVVRRLMEKAKSDPALVTFVESLTYVALMAFVIIAALSRLGVQTTSFIAVLGAAGLAVGLALQGSLANFAAGVLLLIFRPFKSGDLIEAAGVLGTVTTIGIFTTTVLTPDNKRVIIPNAKLTGDNITNYTAESKRRVDLVIGVSYDADLKKAKEVLSDVLASDERILADPPPTVGVVELADSSVNFVVRPWTHPDNYWDLYFDTMQRIKEQLDAAGVGIPFPQTDVHLYQNSS